MKIPVAGSAPALQPSSEFSNKPAHLPVRLQHEMAELSSRPWYGAFLFPMGVGLGITGSVAGLIYILPNQGVNIFLNFLQGLAYIGMALVALAFVLLEVLGLSHKITTYRLRMDLLNIIPNYPNVREKAQNLLERMDRGQNSLDVHSQQAITRLQLEIRILLENVLPKMGLSEREVEQLQSFLNDRFLDSRVGDVSFAIRSDLKNLRNFLKSQV